MKKTNGITLIALVITIIVMFMLVAVSVQVLVKSDLIGTAEKTADEYKTAYEDEHKMGVVKIGDKYYTLQEYSEMLNNNNKNRIKFTYSIETAENNLSALITVNARMLGGPIDLYNEYLEYYEWAEAKLEGKTDEEIEQIFVEGNNYWNELGDYREPDYENIDELVEYWIEEFGYEDCNDIYDIVEYDGYNSLKEMTVDLFFAYPDEYKYWEYVGYRHFALHKLRGKSIETIEQIFVEGNNYWNELEGWGEPDYENIDELVEYWIVEFGYEGCNDIYDIVEYAGYDSLKEMALDWEYVYPEKWYEENERALPEMEMNMIDPEGTIYNDTNVVQYTVYKNGSYTFEAGNSTETEFNSITIDVNTLLEFDTAITVTNSNNPIEVEADNINVSEIKEGVPIPVGFYYVGRTKDTGVVISDDADDLNKGDGHDVVLEGNQFV